MKRHSRGHALCRTAALLLALLLLMPQSTALSILPEPDLQEQPLSVSVTVSVSAYSPLDKTRTGWLSDLLSYHELRLGLTASGTTMAIAVDGSEAFTVSLTQDDSGSTVTTSLLPDRAFSAGISGQTALDRLLGTSSSLSDNDLLPDYNSLQLLTDGEEMVTALERIAGDRMTVKKKKHAINGYGTCTRQLTLTVDEEEANEFGSLLIAACPYGPLMDILVDINYSGDQSLVILTEDDGTVHKVTYEGICGEDGNMRRYKLVWLLSRSDTAVKDELTSTMPPASSSGSDTLTFKRSESLDSKGAFTGKYTYSRSANLRSGKSSVKLEAALTGKPADDGTTAVTGSLSLDTDDDDSEAQHLSFDLKASLNSTTWVGTAEVSAGQSSGGNTLKAADFRISIEPAAASASMEPVLPVTDLDKISDQDLLELRTELLGNAAQQLVARWMMLP